jgi:hypothetical protein
LRWLGGCEKGGWLNRAWIQGRLHEVRIGCRNLAKGAMRHFWKIANRGFVACAGIIFWESPGKNFEKKIRKYFSRKSRKKFLAKLFWEKFGQPDFG